MATAKGTAEPNFKGDGCQSWIWNFFGPAKIAYASVGQENAIYHGGGQVRHLEACSQ